MKNKKKLMTFGILGLFALALVSAGLLVYYGQIQTTVNVEQGLSIDGNAWNVPVIESLSSNSLINSVFVSTHRLNNDVDVDAIVDLDSICVASEDEDSCDEINTNYYETNLREGTLILENKDSTWNILSSDGIQATLVYTFIDGTFNYDLSASGLNDEEYVLIYYADQPDRFVSWGGAPALELGRATASGGFISLEQSVIITGGLLPYPNDWNAGEDANYCNNEDNYEHCKGAKIWLIPSSDYNGIDTMVDWNPTAYLYETDLLGWNTEDVLENPIEVSANSNVDFVVVNEFPFGTIPGEYTITTSVLPVTA